MKKYIIGVHDKEFNIGKNEKNAYVYTENQKLIDLKCKIDNCDQRGWEDAKKKINQFEYIYTSSKMTNNICKISPISRSYFKIHEMIKNDDLLKNNQYCACIAEGPGGFIHCINQYSKYNKIQTKLVYGMTLISDDRKIPYWNQNISNNHANKIINGKDGTGNLYNYENVESFIHTVDDEKCNLVTADGGFDYSDDYNSQELSSYKLIYSEIFLALNIQKNGGSFIIKMFDLFTYKTIQLLFLLYMCYETIEIYKPLTSRLSNSEKYIICKGFTECPKNMNDLLKKYYNDCEKMHIEIPTSFIDDINRFNNMFVEKQMDTIKNILKTIEDSKIINKTPTKNQIKNALQWCRDYDLPINEKCVHLK